MNSARDARVTPVWLLDVDGVLNAVRPGWGAPPRQGNAWFGRHPFRMRWAPELIVRLARLHRDEVVEFRWSTTWVDHIEQVETLLHLPSFPLAFADLPSGPQTKTPALKTAAALHVIENEQRPLIWTDDDAIPPHGRERERLEQSAQRVLLIAPDSRHGLQPSDLDAVNDFLADPLPL